jgi:hypothetical protein
MLCGMTCRRALRQQHFVVTRLHKSDAPLVRAVEPTEQESSRAELLRPFQVCPRGTTPSTTGGATVDEAV